MESEKLKFLKTKTLIKQLSHHYPPSPFPFPKKYY